MFRLINLFSVLQPTYSTSTTSSSVREHHVWFGFCLDSIGSCVGVAAYEAHTMSVARQSALAIAISQSLLRRDGVEIGLELTLVVHNVHCICLAMCNVHCELSQAFPTRLATAVHYGSIGRLTAYPDTG